MVEAHDEDEVKTALNAGARVIGVNNRNLKTFSVDTENSKRLRALLPPDVLFVSESGVGSAQDVAELRAIGADAVLIGETLMPGGGPSTPSWQNCEVCDDKIKLCGLSRLEDHQAANRLRPDYVGFVFASKSCRYVTPTQAKTLKEVLDEGIQAVGVFGGCAGGTGGQPAEPRRHRRGAAPRARG